MRQSLRPETIANEIRLARTSYKGAFLLVEGDTDARVFDRFVDRGHCKVKVAFGRDMAVNVTRILADGGFQGLLTLIDADFDVLEGNIPPSDHILWTEDHDLEMMLVKSPALEHVVREFGSDDKRAVFTARVASSPVGDEWHALRTVLLQAAAPLGYVRWLSLREGLSLRFEELRYAEFVDEKTLLVAEPKLMTTVKNHSQKPALKEATLLDSLNALRSEARNLWMVCCGHDVVSLLSLGLRKTLGTNDAQEVTPDRLERNLRLAYEFAYFAQSQLYALIGQWERTHSPYQILKRPNP